MVKVEKALDILKRTVTVVAEKIVDFVTKHPNETFVMSCTWLLGRVMAKWIQAMINQSYLTGYLDALTKKEAK